MSNLVVSVSPHYHSKNSTQRVMLDVIIAMVPAMIASAVIFGFRAILLTAFSAANCLFLEWVWNKAFGKTQTISDLSACVTGILIAFNVPVGMPIWQLMVGDFIAIIIVKMLFGGLGCNFVNPALVGRVSMMFSFASSMTNYATDVAKIDVLSSATPLSAMNNLTMDNFMTLFLGQHGGVLGETCALAIIIGGLYLIIKKVIKIWIPLTFIGSVFIFTALFGGSNPVLSIFSGGLMLGAFFMATDYVTSPMTSKGQIIFGIGCGFLTTAIRLFANSAEGVSFAILLMNLIVPYINGWTESKPLGGVDNGK